MQPVLRFNFVLYIYPTFFVCVVCGLEYLNICIVQCSYSFLFSLSGYPNSLRQICRLRIRRHLAMEHALSTIPNMELPSLIKQYLLYQICLDDQCWYIFVFNLTKFSRYIYINVGIYWSISIDTFWVLHNIPYPFWLCLSHIFLVSP